MKNRLLFFSDDYLVYSGIIILGLAVSLLIYKINKNESIDFDS
jgi:hypothetical protein